MSEEELVSEMSVDLEDQITVYRVCMVSALMEMDASGRKLADDEVRSLYKWLNECRDALQQHGYSKNEI
jgi:hypothetical protein